MSENKESPPKAKIDSDDIFIRLEDELNKSELDSCGIITDNAQKNKALLNQDGIFDWMELSQIDDKEGCVTSEKIEKFKKDTANKKKNRFTELPWIKYSAILGGAVVLFMSSWFLLSYFLIASSSEDSLMPSKNADIKTGDIISKNLKVELDPFIIPLSGTENVNSFLRITIQLSIQKGYEHKIREETKNIRLVIYNLLSHKKTRDILDFKKLEMIKAELQNILNSILENKIITGVSLMDVLLI